MRQCRVCGSRKDDGQFVRAKTCKNGISNECRSCKTARCVGYYKLNQEEKNKQHSEWSRNNPDKVAMYARNWRRNNPEKAKALEARRQRDPQKRLEYMRGWAHRNRAKVRSYNLAKLRKIRLATLRGLGPKDFLPIARMAEEMRLKTGIKHHVDHIWPLSGKTFSGLNVPWNMRVITAKENLRKSNKHPAEVGAI